MYLEGISGIAEEKKECDSAEKYQKEMLDQGLQFITDVNHDGEICLRMHDGEESDTTLMKYYKYQSEEQDTFTHMLYAAVFSVMHRRQTF